MYKDTNIATSEIAQIKPQKQELFNKLKEKGIFWSYSKGLSCEDMGELTYKLFVIALLYIDDI